MKQSELEELKKYIPEGETHYIKEQFSDERLAMFVSMFFLEETDKAYKDLDEKAKAEIFWGKKEVAYQVIQRLIGNKKSMLGIIQTEDDWNRFFGFSSPKSF